MSNQAGYTLECGDVQRHSLPMGVLGMALQPDSQIAYLACMDGVYRLDLNHGEREFLYAHASYVSGVVYLWENDTLVSAGYDGALQWYDVSSREVVRHIQAHRFWSWDLARADDVPLIASSSGQYLAGGYRYEPRETEEPCVRVYDGLRGQLLSSHRLGPPVQAVALSADGAFVAAGNLMGDAAVWHVGGDAVASWNSPDFTAFGIIKSHCYIGGLYATAFVPGQQQLIVAGMGPMRDPMAGNGKQRWQRFDWGADAPVKVAASKEDQVGEGLMETLAFHPSGTFFVMAGRLRGGSWNAGLFDLRSGELIKSLKTGARITKAAFSRDGRQLLLAGTYKQSGDAKKEFGTLDVYGLEVKPASAVPETTIG